MTVEEWLKLMNFYADDTERLDAVAKQLMHEIAVAEADDDFPAAATAIAAMLTADRIYHLKGN